MNKRVLCSLAPTARRLLTRDFVAGTLPLYGAEQCAELITPVRPEWSLTRLDAQVHWALANLGVADSSQDGELAVRFHQALPLTRRLAADPGVFRYLAVLAYPELVRRRWPQRSYASARGRFWTAGTRHDSNAFSRWWWIAELTRYGDDFALTRRVFSRSVLTTHLFNRRLSHYRPAVEAIVDRFESQPSPLVEHALRNFSKMLSVRVVESLSEKEIRRMLNQALDMTRTG